MKKRRFLSGLLLAPLVARRAATQPSAKVFRIGLLSNLPPAVNIGRLWEAFIQALRQQGFVEGRNLSIELRNAEGASERLPALAAELVRLEVDVLVVGGSAAGPGVQAAKNATRTIPIVMAGVTDPVGQGFVASLAKPGGNITGIADFHAELDPKRLELLKTAAPGIVKVTVLTSPPMPPGSALAQSPWAAEMSKAADQLGVRLSYVRMDSPASFEKAMASIARDGPHALFVAASPLSFQLRKEIAGVAIAQRLPTASSPREMAAAGILLSYGADLLNSSVKAAIVVAKILRGANPGDIAIEQPDTFEIVINMGTAKAIGLTLPRTLIIQANELIT